jgi:hypothetical protein
MTAARSPLAWSLVERLMTDPVGAQFFSLQMAGRDFKKSQFVRNRTDAHVLRGRQPPHLGGITQSRRYPSVQRSFA